MSKRQLNLLGFFKPAGHSNLKKVRIDPDQLRATIETNFTDETIVPASNAPADNRPEREKDDESERDDEGDEEEGTTGETQTPGGIWTQSQFKSKKKYYPWHTMEKTGLGCDT